MALFCPTGAAMTDDTAPKATVAKTTTEEV
jgi:hypothetical protein